VKTRSLCPFNKTLIFISIFLWHLLPEKTLSLVLDVKPSVSTKITYYHISGSTIASLWEQINSYGPPDPKTRKRFSAYTHWRTDWYYYYQQTSNGCYITSATVTTKVEITLPQWKSNGAVEPSVKASWDKFLKALIVHENGHKQHGVLAAREIARNLPNLRPQPNCSGLKSLADKSSQLIVDKYARMDSEYDRATNHGVTQGAILR
jgi:predicted secreted Zn-dependent protease